MIDGRKVKTGDYLLKYSDWKNVKSYLYVVTQKRPCKVRVVDISTVDLSSNILQGERPFRDIFWTHQQRKQSEVFTFEQIENHLALMEMKQ